MVERFQETELLLKEFKSEKHSAWKIAASERLHKFLQENVLKICNQGSNFETS